MLLTEFLEVMEKIAPKELAMDFDNVGLLVGTTKKDIKKILVALDATLEVVQEAAEGGFDLVLTHHPVLLKPQRAILPDLPETAVVFSLVQNNIGLFAAHTNLDAAPGGVNDSFAQLLDLQDIKPLEPVGLGRIGTLTTPLPLKEFALKVEKTLNTTCMVSEAVKGSISKVAVVGGSGGSEILSAVEQKVDVLVTGEVKHHEALMAKQLGLNLIAAGHFETESLVCGALIRCLQSMETRVEYKLANSMKPCLVRAEYLSDQAL